MITVSCNVWPKNCDVCTFQLGNLSEIRAVKNNFYKCIGANI